MEIQAQELHPPRNRENLCMLFFAVLNDFPSVYWLLVFSLLWITCHVTYVFANFFCSVPGWGTKILQADWCSFVNLLIIFLCFSFYNYKTVFLVLKINTNHIQGCRENESPSYLHIPLSRCSSPSLISFFKVCLPLFFFLLLFKNF